MTAWRPRGAGLGPPATEPADFEVVDAALSDVGLVRAANEDAFVRRPADRLWAVADGMGGHQGGAWASALLAGAIETVEVDADLDASGRRLGAAIQAANLQIHRAAQTTGGRIGTTVAALLLGRAKFLVLWAGDSRAYRLRDGRLTQLTRDHTQVQARVEAGLLRAEDARSHPMAHVLTRAVGAGAELGLESADGDARVGDVFLLCSDGLHGLAADDEIAQVLIGRDPVQACGDLLELCRQRGAADNVTIVAAACR